MLSFYSQPSAQVLGLYGCSRDKGLDHDEVEGSDSPQIFASFWWALTMLVASGAIHHASTDCGNEQKGTLLVWHKGI